MMTRSLKPLSPQVEETFASEEEELKGEQQHNPEYVEPRERSRHPIWKYYEIVSCS
jgi:hypothetical protein